MGYNNNGINIIGLIMGLMMINNGIDIDIVMGWTKISGIDNGINDDQ